jgi:hypothetical protein
MILTAHRPVEEPVKRKLIEAVYFLEVHQARNIIGGNKIPFRRRIDSSKPTCRQNRQGKNGVTIDSAGDDLAARLRLHD